MFTKCRQVVGQLSETAVMMKVDGQIDWVDRHSAAMIGCWVACGCAAMIGCWVAYWLVGGWWLLCLCCVWL